MFYKHELTRRLSSFLRLSIWHMQYESQQYFEQYCQSSDRFSEELSATLKKSSPKTKPLSEVKKIVFGSISIDGLNTNTYYAGIQRYHVINVTLDSLSNFVSLSIASPSETVVSKTSTVSK